MRAPATGVLLVLALVACGDDDAAPGAPPPPTPAASTASASPETDAPAPATAPGAKDRGRLRDLSPHAASFLGDAAEAEFVWLESGPYEIAVEIRSIDVRDAKRVFDASTGTFAEEPVDGTRNPAKAAQNAAWLAAARVQAQRTARLATALREHLREALVTPLALRAPEPPPSHRVIVLRRRSVQLPTPGWAACYAAEADAVVAVLGEDALAARDEFHCAGARRQKTFDIDLAFAITEQVLAKEASSFRAPAGVGRRLAEPLWLIAGACALFSAVECDAGSIDMLENASLSFERVHLRHVLHARNATGVRDATPWTLDTILRVRTMGELEREAARAERASSATPPATDVRALFGDRAWAFAHFSWFAREGRYRPAFLSVLEAVLTGAETPETVRLAYGLDDTAARAQVESDFESHWRWLLDRQVGRNKVTGAWFEPETGPPR